MKRHKSDPDDELFRRQFQKPSQHISKQDEDLFAAWLKETSPSELRKLKYAPEKASQAKTPHPLEDEKKESNENTDTQSLFEYWIHHKLPKNLENKDISSGKGSFSRPQKNTLQPIPTLDLHGSTRSEALQKFQNFLMSIPKGTKKVRVIHGKGLSKGEPSIIRKDIREWLSYQKQHAKWIADFSYEDAKNGGHGATIIWIKRGEQYGK